MSHSVFIFRRGSKVSIAAMLTNRYWHNLFGLAEYKGFTIEKVISGVDAKTAEDLKKTMLASLKASGFTEWKRTSARVYFKTHPDAKKLAEKWHDRITSGQFTL